MSDLSIEDQLINLYAQVRFLSAEDYGAYDGDTNQDLKRANLKSIEKFIDDNEFLVEEIINNYAYRFNVTAPVGGPWYIAKTTKATIYERKGADWYQLTLDTGYDKYVGNITFYEKDWGVDNLKVLINTYFEEYLGIERETHLKFRG